MGRHKAVRLLIKTPPFEKGRHHRNDSYKLVARLWCLINSQFWYDSRLRCDIVDLYFTLYGRRRPPSLPLPELASLNRAQPQWKKETKSFTIPREKREREKVEPEPVVVKQEPVELPDPMMAGVVIKQEPHSLDERADTIHGDMEVPEFLQDPGPGTEMLEPKQKKHKKEKKKKHKKEKKKKEDREMKEEIKLEDGVSQDSRQGGSSGG